MNQQERSSRTPKPKELPSANPYKKPLLLLLLGTTIPLALAFMLAFVMDKPQCPDDYTQAQVDSGNCIVGADMSMVTVLMVLPIIFIVLVWSAVWIAGIWYRIHTTGK